MGTNIIDLGVTRATDEPRLSADLLTNALKESAYHETEVKAPAEQNQQEIEMKDLRQNGYRTPTHKSEGAGREKSPLLVENEVKNSLKGTMRKLILASCVSENRQRICLLRRRTDDHL